MPFAVMLPDPVRMSTSPAPLSSISMSPLPALIFAGPVIPRVDPGMNRDRACSTVPHGDIAGASKHLKVDGAIHLECTVEGSDLRGEAGQRAGENKGQCADGSMTN